MIRASVFLAFDIKIFVFAVCLYGCSNNIHSVKVIEDNLNFLTYYDSTGTIPYCQIITKTEGVYYALRV